MMGEEYCFDVWVGEDPENDFSDLVETSCDKGKRLLLQKPTVEQVIDEKYKQG